MDASQEMKRYSIAGVSEDEKCRGSTDPTIRVRIRIRAVQVQVRIVRVHVDRITIGAYRKQSHPMSTQGSSA
jgi:hypothetical protein